MAKVVSSGLPETILPAQFFTGTARSTPERRLIIAVLWDAIVQLRRAAPGDAMEAELWIRDELENVPISFPQVCDLLGLEPRALADVLLEWRAHSVSGVRGELGRR